jgi:hypothetical protein
MKHAAAQHWAQEEFGRAKLGDRRLTKRVVQTAAGALRRPSSTISRTFGQTAAAEGAFRFVENDRVAIDKLGDASHAAAARRCSAHSCVIVPIDGSSILIRDPSRTRGVGPLSNLGRSQRGIQALHAIGVAPSGATLGVLGRELWIRPEEGTKPKGGRCTAPREARESHRWVTMLKSVVTQMDDHAPDCKPWFQLDRGGDAFAVLDHAVENNLLLTVRACQNRVLTHRGTESTRLFQTIRAVAPLGVLEVDVPAARERKARRASLVLRCARLEIPLPSRTKAKVFRTIGVVMASEKDPPEDGAPKIEWILLTTHAVARAADAMKVVLAYTRRWRIEEFHRTWKSGVCGIESTRLRAYDHIQRWAIIMGSVAARIEQLKFASRTTPEQSAENFFTRNEIDATILLTSENRKIPYEVGDTPTVGELTLWIAKLGGYMGSKNSWPPGSTVIGRGLEYIKSAAAILDLQRRKAKSRRAAKK